MTPSPALVIVGPTASNKSALALEIARQRGDLEIVSVDSMCVYRGMDVGTAKPDAADRAEIRHHMIDIADPDEVFTVARFSREARQAMREVDAASRRSVLVGGTGLYHRSVIDDLDIPGDFPLVREQLECEADTASLHRRLAEMDPLAASRMEPNNRRRVLRALEVTIGAGRPFSSFGPGLESYPPSPHVMIGLHVERDRLEPRIRSRWRSQLEDGFVEEVRQLWEAEHPPGQTASQALGYRELHEHLRGGATLSEASEQAIHRTRRFAVRQIRWFRRDPRIRWVDAPGDETEIEDLAARLAATVY